MFEPIRQYVRQVRRTFYQHEDPPATPFLSMIHYMCIIGFWPAAAHQTGPTVYHPAAGRAYRLYNVYVYVGITVTAVTIVLDLVRAETRGSAKLIADDLTMCCGALIVLFKACSFRHHHAAIVRLFVRLERCYRDQCASSRDWRMLRVRRLYYLQDFAIQVISTALMALMYAGFTLQPFFRDDKALMYRAMLPWDTSATEAGYRAGCLMQLVNSTVVLPCILGMECCGVLVVNQVTMHLHLLRIKWEGLGEDRSGALRADRPFRRFMERRVGELVAEHQMIIELIDDIHAIFQPMYQVQVFASTCTICTSALSILLTIHDDIMYSLRFLFFMMSALFQLLFWCWAGERTYDMSVQINGAAYSSNWVDMDVRLRRKLALVLVRSQRALEFTADPFYVLNFESFSAILSASSSYFTILRTLLES